MTENAKTELLARLHGGYSQFRQLLAPLSPAQLQTAGVLGSWSIKDIVAHFIAHEQFAFNELAAAQQGQPYAPNNSDTLNEAAVTHFAQTPAAQVLQAWDESFQQIIAAVEALSEADFAAGSSVTTWLNDTIDGALANNTYEHYAEHTPAIQAWIERNTNA